MYVIINLMHLVVSISRSRHPNGLLLDINYSYISFKSIFDDVKSFRS